MFFAELKPLYHLPSTNLFRYVQFRHASHTQFGMGCIILQSSDLELLLCDNSLTKALSRIYKSLFPKTLLRPYMLGWYAAAPGLDRGDYYIIEMIFGRFPLPNLYLPEIIFYTTNSYIGFILPQLIS